MQEISLLIVPPDLQREHLTITGRKYHHLVHVRRVRVGTPLRAVLPDGRTLHAVVEAITPDELRARITGEDLVQSAPRCRIALYQAVLKGEKMELVVQKAGELGAARLAPVLASRSIPRWTEAQAADKAQRWQRIADAAAEQCERCLPLQVDVPCSLPATLREPAGLRLLLHERHGGALAALPAQYPYPPEIALYIGPEGGWDDAEADAIIAAGGHPLHLGPRILRAETASLVALTLAQYLWGDLGEC